MSSDFNSLSQIFKETYAERLCDLVPDRVRLLVYGEINGKFFNRGDFEKELKIVSSPLYIVMNGEPEVRIYEHE
jgi:hypothetical protein